MTQAMPLNMVALNKINLLYSIWDCLTNIIDVFTEFYAYSGD